jgi:hypothetical protein
MGFKEYLSVRLKSFGSGFRSGGWDGNNLNFWHPDHPLSRASATFGGMSTNREQIENDFLGYVQGAFKANGPVFSCITARQLVFSEAEFKFKNKSTGKLHGNGDLSLLEVPWPGGTTGNLLSRMEQDVSLSGNSWWTIVCDVRGVYGRAARDKPGARLAHLPANWVTMVVGQRGVKNGGDPRAIDAQLLGILYQPINDGGGSDVSEKLLLPIEDVAHYAPIPDPVARFRGMSWLTPVLRDIEADKSAVKHKGAFFDNAAVPNMAVSFDKETSKEDFEEFVEGFNGNHSGSWNAYKTLFLMGGADVTPLSHDFRALDFTNIVGKGEARIASAAGVPPSWVGMSEGMQGSALNTGNMAANRRRFADGTIRPLWRDAVASLAVLIQVPEDSVLWWDESGIAFLREDQADLADIMNTNMAALNQGILAGFKPDAVAEAIQFHDLRKLVGQHTGLVSVQMQPPVENNHDKEEAEVLLDQAKTLQALLDAGATMESAIKAIQAHDLSLVKEDPQAALRWTPDGRAMMTTPGATPPGGAKPPAAGGKPATSAPTGQPKKPTPGGGAGG